MIKLLLISLPKVAATGCGGCSKYTGHHTTCNKM
jgi:hypothetical protein